MYYKFGYFNTTNNMNSYNTTIIRIMMIIIVIIIIEQQEAHANSRSQLRGRTQGIGYSSLQCGSVYS